MPEGDTVWITAQRLDNALTDREVSRFDLRVPSLALADLTGQLVLAVIPVGKHLLIRFSGGLSLHSHLRMDGAWRVDPQGRSSGPDHAIRALVGNSDWLATGLRVHDLSLLPTTDEQSVVGHLGPDLLAADFDADEAVRRYTACGDRPVGEVLLDQRVTAGIGNVYKSELLFMNRVNPWRPAGEVDPAPLFRDAVRLLKGNLGTFNRSTTGWNQRGQQYWVYGRLGKACRRCGSPVRRAMQGDNAAEERVTYFCAVCQPP